MANWGSFMPGGVPFTGTTNLFGTEYNPDTWQPAEDTAIRSPTSGYEALDATGRAQANKLKKDAAMEALYKSAGWENPSNVIEPTGEVNQMGMLPSWSGIMSAAGKVGPALRGLFSWPGAGVYGTGKMAATQGNEMMDASNAANAAGLNLEDYIERDGTRVSINPQFYQDAAPDRFSNTVAPGVGGKNISSLDFAPPYTGGRKHGPDDPMGGGLMNLIMSSVSPRWGGTGEYTERFPGSEFQKGLGGHYTPDEKFNMEQFGQLGKTQWDDPRKDDYGMNIVSLADDYEEGLRDWVEKYGKFDYKTKKQQLRQKNQIAALQRMDERREDQARQEALVNRRAVEQHTGQPMSQYRRDRPASERRFTGHGRSGMGRDPSDRMAYGGRVGYKTGGRVGILQAF